jgi:hypothetical protein
LKKTTGYSSEIRCGTKDIPEVCRHPYNPYYPLVCRDETTKQLIGETRIVIPAAPGQTEKYDYEYERNGVNNLFMIFAPSEGQRYVKVTDHRTATDRAGCVRDITDVYFPHAEKIISVTDNLNIHKPSSLYKAFLPEESRRISDKPEIHYTPKHGSCPDTAETESGVLHRRCLNCRIPDQERLKQKAADWEPNRNKKSVKAEWRFTTEDARMRLKKLYPSVES